MQLYMYITFYNELSHIASYSALYCIGTIVNRIGMELVQLSFQTLLELKGHSRQHSGHMRQRYSN